MRIIRNVFRRKLRSSLTIVGIMIGVFALVVMGAMAEKINLLIDGGVKYYADKVTVADKGAQGGFGAPLSMKRVEDVENVEGVADAFPVVMMPLRDNQGMSFGVPPMVMAISPKANEYEDEKFDFGMAEGRELKEGDRGKAVVGSDLVKDLGAEVGSTIKVRGREFEVVGIMEKTLTAPDSEVMVSIPDAQELLAESLPEALQKTVDKDELISAMIVYPTKGTDADDLAERINTAVPAVKATGPSEIVGQMQQATKIFNLIMFGIAGISLLVGGLSVINTMMMSVAERTKEIGIKKAIGASSGRVVREFLGEAATIGGIGGLLGLGLGALIAYGANSAMADSGTVLFLVTGRLSLGAILFAIVLGSLAGLYPSWHAAGLNPVRALRYE
ncbi:MAG: ABC transporter permease [Candidatus Aquicultorales bacterium]